MSKNKTPKKKEQYIPTCIFCKSKPLTLEHVWPQWIEKEFSKEGEDKHIVNNYQTLSQDGSRIRYSSKLLNRHVTRMVVKKVCVSCNSGWMSRIETESKPIIKSLILDESITLTLDEQTKLARWGVLRAIIGEYADAENHKQIISKEERLNFFQTKIPSPKFKIWVGRSLVKEGAWKQFFIHFNAYQSLQNLTLLSPPEPNLQWSLFVKGAFVIIIYWSEIQCDIILPAIISHKLVQIHPLENTSFKYESILSFSEEELEYIRKNLTKHSFAIAHT